MQSNRCANRSIRLHDHNKVAIEQTRQRDVGGGSASDGLTHDRAEGLSGRAQHLCGNGGRFSAGNKHAQGRHEIGIVGVGHQLGGISSTANENSRDDLTGGKGSRRCDVINAARGEPSHGLLLNPSGNQAAATDQVRAKGLGLWGITGEWHHRGFAGGNRNSRHSRTGYQAALVEDLQAYRRINLGDIFNHQERLSAGTGVATDKPKIIGRSLTGCSGEPSQAVGCNRFNLVCI